MRPHWYACAAAVSELAATVVISPGRSGGSTRVVVSSAGRPPGAGNVPVAVAPAYAAPSVAYAAPARSTQFTDQYVQELRAAQAAFGQLFRRSGRTRYPIGAG